jgi:hypothetical protein
MSEPLQRDGFRAAYGTRKPARHQSMEGPSLQGRLKTTQQEVLRRKKFASMAAVVKSAARARQNHKTGENLRRGRMKKPRLNPPASTPKPRVFQRNLDSRSDPDNLTAFQSKPGGITIPGYFNSASSLKNALAGVPAGSNHAQFPGRPLVFVAETTGSVQSMRFVLPSTRRLT